MTCALFIVIIVIVAAAVPKDYVTAAAQPPTPMTVCWAAALDTGVLPPAQVGGRCDWSTAAAAAAVGIYRAPPPISYTTPATTAAVGGSRAPTTQLVLQQPSQCIARPRFQNRIIIYYYC